MAAVKEFLTGETEWLEARSKEEDPWGVGGRVTLVHHYGVMVRPEESICLESVNIYDDELITFGHKDSSNK